MSTGRMPWALSSRTRDASIEGGRPAVTAASRRDSRRRRRQSLWSGPGCRPRSDPSSCARSWARRPNYYPECMSDDLKTSNVPSPRPRTTYACSQPLKTANAVSDGDTTILGCGSIAPSVVRRARIVTAHRHALAAKWTDGCIICCSTPHARYGQRQANTVPITDRPRHALANKGHDTRAIQGWLGHRSITSTAVYTALAPNRFKDFWRD
jgi:hypothetical protein